MKPRYHFFKNTQYALSGLKAMLQKERSFQIEVLLAIPMAIGSFFLELNPILHALCLGSLLLVLIVESLNSAIEACVDLCTQQFHPLAKIAKDCGSCAVFLSIVLACLLWALSLYDRYGALICAWISPSLA